MSASTGEISLATVLIIGFALHYATEGCGIVGPLGAVRPSWGWLALAGLIGGGPTFLGSIVGYNVTSEPLELVFYAVAGGVALAPARGRWLDRRNVADAIVRLSVAYVLALSMWWCCQTAGVGPPGWSACACAGLLLPPPAPATRAVWALVPRGARHLRALSFTRPQRQVLRLTAPPPAGLLA